jgi:hypothetical protein
MREFTKSMTSYTWAMSLFGLQQMINVFRPAKATQAFDHVTKATEDQFGDALKATFLWNAYARHVRSRRRKSDYGYRAANRRSVATRWSCREPGCERC